ncbi:MAG: DMT family transporter [Eubacteriales bacterium]|nr:DMT family transporter [Eubacteriales bacterium]
MKEGNQKSSMLMLVSAMLIFGTIGIFRKYIPLSSGLLACARGFQGTLFLFLFVIISGKKVRHGIGGKKVALLMVSGAVMGLNWMLLFEAYNYTTVPIATLCYYMEPTIVILMSPMIFQERLTKKKIICALIAIVGMIFVSGILDGNHVGTGSMKGILFGLAAAMLYSMVVIMNKLIGQVDAYEKTMIQLGSAALAMVPYVLLTEKITEISWDKTSVIMLILVGFVHTGIAYVLYFGSIEKLPAQTIAIFSYLDPITALLLAALLLGESLSIYGMLGAAFILGTAFVSERS